jgi:S-adenosyl-L-methionine hydrolase (adenosine-forming)
MPRPIITLTTDFGGDSSYVAQMKGVILSINAEIVIVDITHQVAPQDIRQAALILDQAAPRFPPGTTHICVVDPGVGTDRKIVFVPLGAQALIAPDNGVLSRLVRRESLCRAVALTDPTFWLHPVSNTFHGRDIMAPVAAHFASGVSPDRFGPPVAQLQSLDWPEPRLDGREIRGCVLHVDSFGNLITNIGRDLVEQLGNGDALSVQCAGRIIHGVVRTYGHADAGTLIALISSSGLLEIAEVQGSAAQRLNVAPNHQVIVTTQRGSGALHPSRPERRAL